MYQNQTNFATKSQVPLTLDVKAQGSLFAVKIESGLPRQQKHSTARDHQRYQRLYDKAYADVVATLPADKKYISFEWTYPSECKSFTPEQRDKLIECGAIRPVIRAAKLEPDQLHQIDIAVQRAALASMEHEPTRGSITLFSHKSRLRLLRLTARMREDTRGLFVTLTYRANQRDHIVAKAHLDKTLRWLKYHYPDFAYIWRMEYQQRGAIHFHILALGARFIDAKALTEYWQALTGDESFPDVKRIKSRRHAMYYVSKYTAKPLAKVASGALALQDQLAALALRSPRLMLACALLLSCGFIYVPYSEKSGWTGRFWGVVNRAALPFAPLVRLHITSQMSEVAELRRYARRKFAGLNKHFAGFSLFTGNNDRWLLLLETIVKSSLLYVPSDITDREGYDLWRATPVARSGKRQASYSAHQLFAHRSDLPSAAPKG